MSTDLESLRIGFIGAGRVAQTLAQAFVQANLQVVSVQSRNAETVDALRRRVPSVRAMSQPQEVVDACDLVLLTVSDDAIAAVCSGLHWSRRHRVIHCSGATEISALDHAKAAGAAIGGFHPMQMFANPDVALAGLPGCTVGVEAEAELQSDLEALARRIGCVSFALPVGVRPLYHASAYYVGPFLIALLHEGVQLWKSFGASEHQALQAMVPLLRGTMAAVLDDGLAKGMGGCVARGDVGTVVTHLAALDDKFPLAGVLYRELAVRNVPLGIERGTLSPDRAADIERALRYPVSNRGGQTA